MGELRVADTLDPVPDVEHNREMTRDLERASEEASRLFVEIYEKLETRKVDPGIYFKSLVELFRNTLKSEGVGLLEALAAFRLLLRRCRPPRSGASASFSRD